MIKFFTVLLTFLFSQHINSQEYWLQQVSPTNKNLRTCVFTDSLKGWISGDSGIIIHTSNNGQSWVFQNTQINGEVVSMHFVNERLGFALAWETDLTPPNHYGTRILSTTNGGNNWSNYLYPDSNLFLSTIYFLDSLIGYMAGSEGKLFYTTNSGLKWLESSIDSSMFTGFPVEKIKFVNYELGFAVGGAFDIAGMIWKTTNGGRGWRSQIVGPEPIHDLYIFDSLNVIGVGGDYEYGSSNVKTSNAGFTWEYAEYGIFGIANTIDFRTESEAWISLGIVDSFLVTTNGGNNWRLVGTPNGAKIYNLIFVDERNGWAVGKDGVILKFNSSLIKIKNEINLLPITSKLHQNYPNPFNPETIITYELFRNNGTASVHVKLILYDILGKEIKTLVDEKQNAGIYKITFDGSNLQSGIYFIKLLTHENGLKDNAQYSETKKMILIK